MKKIVLILGFFAVAFLAKAQHLFPEKFEGCDFEDFAFERNEPNAKIGNVELLTFFMNNIPKDVFDQLKGGISLQILVDTVGNSCLLSAENQTNASFADIGLKKSIDEKLVWGAPTELVSVVLVVSFSDEGFEIKRLGNDAAKGWHQMMF